MGEGAGRDSSATRTAALGMVVDSTELPNYEIPPFDSIGTNEAIVDVTHGLRRLPVGLRHSAVAELNCWYHMLNCGFRAAMVGETDYPCITGERAGRDERYVGLDIPRLRTPDTTRGWTA